MKFEKKQKSRHGDLNQKWILYAVKGSIGLKYMVACDLVVLYDVSYSISIGLVQIYGCIVQLRYYSSNQCIQNNKVINFKRTTTNTLNT